MAASDPSLSPEDLHEALRALSGVPHALGRLASAQESMGRELTEFKGDTGVRLDRIDGKVSITNGRVTTLEKVNEREAGIQAERARQIAGTLSSRHLAVAVAAVIVGVAGIVTPLVIALAPHNTASSSSNSHGSTAQTK